jgi:hypothetical protein
MALCAVSTHQKPTLSKTSPLSNHRWKVGLHPEDAAGVMFPAKSPTESFARFAQSMPGKCPSVRADILQAHRLLRRCQPPPRAGRAQPVPFILTRKRQFNVNTITRFSARCRSVVFRHAESGKIGEYHRGKYL